MYKQLSNIVNEPYIKIYAQYTSMHCEKGHASDSRFRFVLGL